MDILENDTARPGTLAELLSYLAVAPLLLCLACLLLPAGYSTHELAQRGAIAWGAVLLAATGAVHWGLALAGRLPASALRTAVSALPTVVATAAVLIGGQHGLALLIVGSGLFWLYEHRALGAQLPPAYLGLRRNLSVAVCSLLALMVIATDAAELL